MPVVEAEFALLQMRVEGLLRQSVGLGQAAIGKASEAFDAVDVVGSFSEVVVAVADAQVGGILTTVANRERLMHYPTASSERWTRS